MQSSTIKTFLSREEILERTSELAKQISYDYRATKDVVLLCILKGAVNFFGDLSLMLDIDAEYAFIGLSSYAGTESSGLVEITTTLPDLSGKNVIIIEDIIDTGRSMAYLKPYLSFATEALDVKICTLLDKPSRREVKFKPDYTGFEIDDVFVVGYGLDYDQKYRNLDFVGVLK